MEKALFALCLLAALSSAHCAPSAGRGNWDLSMHAGEDLHFDMQIEASGVEWRVKIRGQILNYASHGCIARWRSCRA